MEQQEDRFDLVRLWELELVISGALIVALFQIPQHLDQFFLNFRYHVSTDIHLAPFMVFYMGKLLIYPLITTFILHFFFRSFWIGLKGLRHVFPGGIQFDKLGLAPLQSRFAREQGDQGRRLENALDKTCSSLFSVLFITLTLFLWMSVLVGFSIFVAWAVKALFTLEIGFNTLFIIVFYSFLAFIFLPLIIANILDKKLFKNDADSADRPGMSRFILGIYKISNIITLSALCAPVLLTFKSHFSSWKAQLGIMAYGLLFPIGFAVSFFIGQGVLRYDSYMYFPLKGEAQALDYAHYQNLTDEGAAHHVPTIQSDIISEPYLRLFIPFRAKNDNKRVADQCPDIEPARREGFYAGIGEENLSEERRVALLECLASVYTITIDDVPTPATQFFFSQHPTSKIRGLQTYIPVDTLGKGQHRLRIEKQPEDEKEKPKVYYIPFWL